MFRTHLQALAAMAGLLLAACGGQAAAPTSSPPGSAAAAKPASAAASTAAVSASAKPNTSSATAIKVRYGLPTAPPAITTVGVYFGLDNGFFKEQGLDVEVTSYNGAVTAIRALLSRDADIVETGGDTTF